LDTHYEDDAVEYYDDDDDDDDNNNKQTTAQAGGVFASLSGRRHPRPRVEILTTKRTHARARKKQPKQTKKWRPFMYALTALAHLVWQ
jgi:hypothetical protein